jgi:exodeoxyribonuclease VII large subunit
VTLSLPFGPEPGADGPSDEVWSVAELNAAAKAVVEDGFALMWVRGEVTGFRVYQSGHWYFDLKDEGARVRCTMWKFAAQRCPERPADGAEVFVFGKPSLWEEKGEFSFSVQRLLLTNRVGQQALEFERIKAALARDGLFDAARKRSLPPFPQTIAVVTSPDGAALRDIVRVARQRWPAVRLLLVPTRVQGIEAVAEVVRALRMVNELACDCCIVGRGGGSKEDLAVFNDEAVCRALAMVRIPTISAVGHETDVSLADFVADVRAATPSMAAQLAVPAHADVTATVASLGERLAGGLSRHTRFVGERLARTADRMEAAIGEAILSHRFTLERMAAQLDALSPLRVLERGFAIPLADDGAVLRGRAAFAPGRRFDLRLADGTVPARVEEEA